MKTYHLQNFLKFCKIAYIIFTFNLCLIMLSTIFLVNLILLSNLYLFKIINYIIIFLYFFNNKFFYFVK